MLVLTRKLNESVKIGNEIKIRVIRIQGNRISLGIEAPNGVSVMREELVARQGDCGKSSETPRS